jgi:glycerol-3-phosphate acyltransferase PlsY
MLACGGASIIGHCYPVWFDFAGGKGAATLVGMLIAVAPGLMLPGLIVFAGVLVLTGWVGLATMTSVTALPVVLWFRAEPDSFPVILTLILLAVFIIFTHRSNVVRIMRGEEDRIEKVMLFRRRQSDDQRNSHGRD